MIELPGSLLESPVIFMTGSNLSGYKCCHLVIAVREAYLFALDGVVSFFSSSDLVILVARSFLAKRWNSLTNS